MGWNEPSLPDIEATCDRCGQTDYIGPDNTTSGHWLYPQPEDIGWGHGDEGLLCPDCLNGVDLWQTLRGKGAASGEVAVRLVFLLCLLLSACVADPVTPSADAGAGEVSDPYGDGEVP